MEATETLDFQTDAIYLLRTEIVSSMELQQFFYLKAVYL